MFTAISGGGKASAAVAAGCDAIFPAAVMLVVPARGRRLVIAVSSAFNPAAPSTIALWLVVSSLSGAARVVRLPSVAAPAPYGRGRLRRSVICHVSQQLSVRPCAPRLWRRTRPTGRL